MRFEIEPYAGALPIRFGMGRGEVIRFLGRPKHSHPTWNDSGAADSYEGVSVGFDNAGLVNHVGFSPGSVELSIQGESIWNYQSQPDPNPILLAFDPEPIEYVGFWIFRQIGVTTTGYHDDDRNQYALTVFPRGSYVEILPDAKPADIGKYRPAHG
jgi:hypothetical protein